MPCDEDLADRLRELLAKRPAVSEKKMFGGIGFMIDGNMAIAASNTGGLLVRAEPSVGADLIATKKARPMKMRGREMTGWLRVASEDVRTSRQLAKWVEVGASAAASLPKKR